MNRAGKPDANQAAIVDGLRKLGASVWITSGLGKGFPDLCVGYEGYNFLFEVKDGDKPPSKRQLTEDEAKFFAEWKGQVRVIENLTGAVLAIDEAIL